MGLRKRSMRPQGCFLKTIWLHTRSVLFQPQAWEKNSLGLAKDTHNKNWRYLKNSEGQKALYRRNVSMEPVKRDRRGQSHTSSELAWWKSNHRGGPPLVGPPTALLPSVAKQTSFGTLSAFILVCGYYLWQLVFIGISKESVPKGE